MLYEVITEIFTHPLFYPVADGDLPLYYAITCTDKVGNVGVHAANIKFPNKKQL